MKIINIGILAHVDAGKTTLTESLLYASGAISEPGSVEKGTTRTDTMFLERQRGITIQAAVTSFQWHRCKVNIVDTPGHMDFLAEVYRSLAVLDGAILVISAKDGVQAQTRILFHALRKMNIPTVIFINKIDQAGVDLQSVVQSVRDKLSADIIIKQTVSLSPEIVLEENTDIEAWDAVIENNDELLEKYIAGEPISREKLAREEQQRVQDCISSSRCFVFSHVFFSGLGSCMHFPYFSGCAEVFLPNMRASLTRRLWPVNSRSRPWCTMRSMIAAASLSSAKTVPHLLNSMFVVNMMLRLS